MRRLLVILVLLAGFVSLPAQTYWDGARADKLLSFGLRAGVNFSKQYSSDLNMDLDYRVGYQVGFEADLNLCRSMSINTGVYLIQKGYKGEVKDFLLKVHDNPTYIEFPLLASYRIPLSDATTFQLNVGPYFAYGVGGTYVMEYGGNGDSAETESFDMYDGLKRFDMGLSYGCAVTMSKLYIGACYEHGLIKAGQRTSNNAKNASIVITLGYNFK